MTARTPGSAQTLQEGELVVLRDRKRRRYLVTLEPDGEWHSHAGVVRHDDLIGLPEGSAVRSTGNMEITALRPTQEDYVLEMRRGAQVVYRKDRAMILALADIRPGCTVVEAGAGSGALSIALLEAVAPSGSVRSFDRREDHLEIAKANVAAYFGARPEAWNVELGDIGEALPDLECDRVVLDVLEPWEQVSGAGEALRPGGLLVAYTPTVPQVMRLAEALDEDERFDFTQTSETLHRTWKASGLSVRPDHRMVAHTAFITVSRRVLTPAEGGPVSRRRSSDSRGVSG